MDDRGLLTEKIRVYMDTSHGSISHRLANHNVPYMEMGKCWKLKMNKIDPWLAKVGPEKSRKRLNRNYRQDTKCPLDGDIFFAIELPIIKTIGTLCCCEVKYV